MGKASRLKKQRKMDPGSFESEHGADTSRQWIRPAILIGIPLLTAGIAAGCWYGLESPSMTGIAGLFGAGAWIVAVLTDLGSTIPSSGRSGSGSIDFGTRG